MARIRVGRFRAGDSRRYGQQFLVDNLAVAQRFLRLEPTPVFYAPLDGSRIDYHPCGRPEDHPTYLDPDSPIGDQRVAPEELHQYRRAMVYYTTFHQCGTCGRAFFGEDAHGRYILHPCSDAQWRMTVAELRELALRIDVETALAERARSLRADLRFD